VSPAQRRRREPVERPGEKRLRDVIRTCRPATCGEAVEAARSEDPRPYDNAWGWWIEERIVRLENGQTWLIRIAIGALVAEIIRIVAVTAGLSAP
jgi:hypothetical protein